MSDTFIIAEAGVNHNGSLDRAFALVDAAAMAGADAVKFQTFRAEKLVTRTARKARYQGDGNQFEMLRALELDAPAHHALLKHCTERNIEFLSTPFDEQSCEFLVSLGMTRIKISSGDLTNLPLLQTVGAIADSVILSTGMSTLAEVEQAVDALADAGTAAEDLALLHCNTQYPTPDCDANLRAMATLRSALPHVAIGYSDHTEGLSIALAAVALGATVLEKHFTLDRTLPGPDHRASLEPKELDDLVKGVRRIGRALGDGVKRPTPSEHENISVARKFIVAAQPIRQGDTYTSDNLTTRRTGEGGVSPMRLATLFGTAASRNWELGEPIHENESIPKISKD